MGLLVQRYLATLALQVVRAVHLGPAIRAHRLYLSHLVLPELRPIPVVPANPVCPVPHDLPQDLGYPVVRDCRLDLVVLPLPVDPVDLSLPAHPESLVGRQIQGIQEILVRLVLQVVQLNQLVLKS